VVGYLAKEVKFQPDLESSMCSSAVIKKKPHHSTNK